MPDRSTSTPNGCCVDELEHAEHADGQPGGRLLRTRPVGPGSAVTLTWAVPCAGTLLDQLNAETRFQAGAQASRRGLV